MVKLTGPKKIKTAVFISGTGSNLKNLIKFSKIKNSPISIDLIFSNTSKAKGLKFSNQFNIKKYVSSFKNYKIAETKILNLLKKDKSEYINVEFLNNDKIIDINRFEKPEQDLAKKYINNYKGNFPSKKVIFTEGVKVGDSYQVKCWIGETVKIPEGK